MPIPRSYGLLLRGVLFLKLALSGQALFAQTSGRFDLIRSGVVDVGQLGEDRSPQWLGTGFLVDAKCTFATAKHVLVKADKSRVVIRFQNPQRNRELRTFAARVLHEAPDSDLAFLRVDLVGDKPCRSGSVYAFPLAKAVPGSSLIGESVWIIGHPMLAQGANIAVPVVRQGILASVEIRDKGNNRTILLLDLVGVPGYSGSPVVLLRTGEVIGIVFGPGPTARAYGFEWATPLTHVDYESAIAAAIP